MKFERMIKAVLLAIGYIMIGLWLDYGMDVYMGTVMIWNVFLGCLPLLFSTVFLWSNQPDKKVLHWFLLGAWLLFFPNSIYLVTDFIHTNSIDFYQVTTSSVIYYQDIVVWLEFLYIGAGVVGGTCVGLYSLLQVISELKKEMAIWKIYLFKGLVFLLSGFGIYIGRFLRLNSWDIFQPWSLMGLIAGQLNQFSLMYALLMALYTFFLYEVFVILVKRRGSHD